MYNVITTDVRSMTKAHIQGRRYAISSWERMRREKPGFENAHLTQVASVLGIREGRHIKGEYMLTALDLCNNTYFDDAVMTFGYGMDMHSLDGTTVSKIIDGCAQWYTIPYRCLVPVNVRNLLVAGKTICAESLAAGSFRVMPGCMALGEAAGAAAAIAFEKQTDVKDIPIRKLQKTLMEANVIIMGHSLDEINKEIGE